MSFAREIKRYILQSGGVTKKELIKKFGNPDAIKSMLNYGRKTGQIIERDGLIYYIPRQFNADRIYKAVRILKNFTTKDIALYTSLDIRQVNLALRDFEKAGYIKRAGKKEGNRRAVVWVLVKDDPQRPPLKGGSKYACHKRQNKASNDSKDTHSKA